MKSYHVCKMLNVKFKRFEKQQNGLVFIIMIVMTIMSTKIKCLMSLLE